MTPDQIPPAAAVLSATIYIPMLLAIRHRHGRRQSTVRLWTGCAVAAAMSLTIQVVFAAAGWGWRWTTGFFVVVWAALLVFAVLGRRNAADTDRYRAERAAIS